MGLVEGIAELQNRRPLILPVKLLERVGEKPKGLDGKTVRLIPHYQIKSQ